MNKNRVKENLIVVVVGIIVLLVLSNLATFRGAVAFVVGVFIPVTYGFIIAYILRGPFNFLRDKALRYKGDGTYFDKLKPVLALLLSYTLFIGFVVVLLMIVVPQIWESINTLVPEIQKQYIIAEEYVEQLLIELNLTVPEIWVQIEATWQQLLGIVTGWLSSLIPSLMNWIFSITSSVINMVIALVFSVYFLLGKETLGRQVKQVTYAIFREKTATYLVHVKTVVDKAFSGFIAGQLLESCIVGFLCSIGMTIFNFPYVMLVSVIIGVTNIVPMVGPWIGTIPASFIILMADITDPMKVVWFILFIIVLQQLESNLIYPRVVGSSLGLPGFWVMFAITIGGNLLGLIGIILGVPSAAAIYKLSREATYNRLKAKQLKIE
ncbi:MAG: hypothetical protein ATN34_00630 [Epulopiscium sp. Nele67-Bin002]|nr:MAG: hypothetical protein ATN34_00630 [Epulopiscium sp. Nele67-Bin002]OON94940.1 MAG: hypothetical protein ATN33_00030 [Epulopiscium sp. Nele67-Bin001]